MIDNVQQGRGLTFLSTVFPYQSYFDSTALHTAVRDPGAGDFLAKDNLQSENIAGYGVALHPSSETPVAVEFQRAQGSQAGSKVILKPGQIVYPFGREASARFEGLRFGLPAGWLGGGMATLVVITSPEALLDWPKEEQEVVFHRQRILVQRVSIYNWNNTVWPRNWPTRFPSMTTRRAGTGLTLDQSGRPSLRVAPTRTQLSLRVNTIPAPVTTRMVLLGSEAFELDNVGALDTPGRFTDVVWPETVDLGGNPPPQYPVVEFKSGPLVSLGTERVANCGLIVLGDTSATLQPVAGTPIYMDIVRYGHL